MRNVSYFKDKKITIVGLARSGLACANILERLGSEVFITDNKDNDGTRSYASQLNSAAIKIELGRHSKDFIAGKDLVIISPGVPRAATPFVWAKELKIPVISEIEFAWILCPATVIAVTGSNGKTTTTTLIGKILEAAGKKVFVCGNIGNPFSGEIEKMGEGDFVSLEISSFQLEHIDTFKPQVAVIINFSPNHLDRHKDMQEYLEAKRRIFINQDKNDYTVLNAQDPIVSALSVQTHARVVYFSGSEDINPNYAAVMAVGLTLGIDREITLGVLKNFKGIEHRMEYVAEINNVKFINDSKATTVESTQWALNTIKAPVILIAGGRHKGIDYRTLLPLAKNKVRQVILIGEARPILAEAFKGELAFEEAESLEDAVRLAMHKASAGDCVLFSPMCSSFDMFSNYEERGRVFKKAVADLANKEIPR